MKALMYLMGVLLLPAFVLGEWNVTEVMYDPAGSDTDREWVEFFGDPIPESALFLEDGTPHAIALVQGACISDCISIIADDATTFLSEFSVGSDVLVYDSSWASLKNSGETVGLEVNGTSFEVLYPAIAPSGQSVHYSTSWSVNTPNPGDMTVSMVPEFSVIAASLCLFICTLLIFKKRKHI